MLNFSTGVSSLCVWFYISCSFISVVRLYVAYLYTAAVLVNMDVVKCSLCCCQFTQQALSCLTGEEEGDDS